MPSTHRTLLALAFVMPALTLAAARPARAATYTVLHNFNPGPNGTSPEGLVQDAAGNLYGIAALGGAAGQGVIFKIDSSGQQTVLYSFSGGADGANPVGSLILDAAGNLYGAASDGGHRGCQTYGCGVIFKLDPAGHLTVLYSFSGGADGGTPPAGVTLDAAGNLYGTASAGGSGKSTCIGGCGVVYKLDPTGHQTVLHSFAGGSDGAYPNGGITLDPSGNLYGATPDGGGNACNGLGCGVVFKVDPAGNETVLYRFLGGADGSEPDAGVVLDSAGNLYGTAASGGSTTAPCDKFGCGVVFKLDTTGHQTVLYTFTGAADGSDPDTGVCFDSAGNLYGTADSDGTPGHGVVFKLDSTGKQTVLYSFTKKDGRPFAGVILDTAGNLYGTTEAMVFKVDLTGKETVIYSFTPQDGGRPMAGVVRDAAGNLYGTTAKGGTRGKGTVFKVDPAGNETVLYNFKGGTHGANPAAGLALDAAGNLYGTADGGLLNCTGGAGRPLDCGMVYKVDTNGRQSILYKFTGGADGGRPQAGVTLDSAGNLYGTTSQAGTGRCLGFRNLFIGCGVVFKLDKSGKETVLYTFKPSGASPYSGVIRDSAGNLYGTYLGFQSESKAAVYKLDKAGKETVLSSFTTAADGRRPYAGVIQDPAGNLYGTTEAGGASGRGTVYKVDTAGVENVLYSFTGGTDGSSPAAGLFRDSAGNLYGTTQQAGSAACNCGVVFQLDPAGNETVLYSFQGRLDGAYPQAALAQDAAGNLYGTTAAGGIPGLICINGCGVVFRLTP